MKNYKEFIGEKRSSNDDRIEIKDAYYRIGDVDFDKVIKILS